MLVFCDAEDVRLMNVKGILKCFLVILDLKINFSKSKLVGVRLEEGRLLDLANILGCKL